MKAVLGMVGFVLVIIVGTFLIIDGPVGIQNRLSGWKANAFGSNWLIVQYTAMGDVLAHWELNNCAVHNEGHSDGIYFTTPHGVVHLSGHYIYVQNPSEEATTIYLRNRLPRVPPQGIHPDAGRPLRIPPGVVPSPQ